MNARGTTVVTGGAGFIGSHLSKALLNEGFEVHIIDNLSSGSKDNVPKGAKLHVADVRHLDEIKSTFKKIGNITYVFHLAAMPEVELSKRNPFKTNEINVVGTDNVLYASMEAGAKKVVFSSSCSVYGSQDELPIKETTLPAPTNPYAFHKLIGEQYCKMFSQTCNLPTVCLRYFNVYGPGQRYKGPYSGVISVFLGQRKENKPLTLTGDGKQTRDFIHVSDVVSANILAAKNNDVNGEVINIGSGRSISVADIARIIGGPIEHLVARDEISRSQADITRALKFLGWTPKVSFEQGLAELKALSGINE
jgi:UDP-glucose 4-epimerase